MVVKKLKIFLFNISPPFIIKFIRFCFIKITSPFIRYKGGVLFENSNYKNYKSIYYEVGTKRRVNAFSVDVEKLYYFGGIKYTSNEHPFFSYYNEGISALNNFYTNHVPNCVMEKHFINSVSNYPLEGVNLPWYEVRDKKDKTGEHGLNYEHGDQHFGPVSDEKIKLEAKRLDRLHESILSKGYRKSHDGYPRGYILEKNNNYSVIIVGGQHRVSTLVYLGCKTIPVIFSKSYPPIVSINDIDNWPYVKAGIIKKNDAIRIFNSYFK